MMHLSMYTAHHDLSKVDQAFLANMLGPGWTSEGASCLHVLLHYIISSCTIRTLQTQRPPHSRSAVPCIHNIAPRSSLLVKRRLTNCGASTPMVISNVVTLTAPFQWPASWPLLRRGCWSIRPPCAVLGGDGLLPAEASCQDDANRRSKQACTRNQ